MNSFQLALVSTLVVTLVLGVSTGSVAQSEGQEATTDEATNLDASKEVEEAPVKPRIRRDSKIIKNEPRYQNEIVDGAQSAVSVSQLREHLTRMAELEYIGELAKKRSDVEMAARVNELLRLERKRYKNAVHKLKLYTRMKTHVGIP